MPALPNARHEQFSQLLVEGCSQAEAYRRAGYSNNRSNASILAHSNDVSKRVAELRERNHRKEEQAIERAAERLMLSKEKVLKGLMDIAFADPRKIVLWNDDGMLVRPSDMIPDDEAMAISELCVGKDGRVKLRLHDKLQALQALGRHLALFKEHVEVAGNFAQDVNADGSDVREIILGKLAVIASRRAENENAGRADEPATHADRAEIRDAGGNPPAAAEYGYSPSRQGIAGALWTNS
jgi:phage terminase small subunit